MPWQRWTWRFLGPSTRVILALGCLGLSGCGEGFVPPPPPEFNSIPDANALPKTRTIQFILTGTRTPERQAWINSALAEGARARAIMVVERPEPTDPPAKQAALIRKAISRGVDAVVVEPADDPDVLAALKEVHASGLPLILLRGAVTVDAVRGDTRKDGTPAPLVRVDYAPYEPAAKTLAEAVMRDAAGSGIPADAHALISVNTEYGKEIDDQVELLKKALREVGVESIETVPFPGEYTVGRDRLVAKMEADSKVHLLIAHDDKSLSAALDTYANMKDRRAMSLAGVMAVDRTLNPNVLTQCAAVVDRNGTALSRDAVQLALRLADRNTVEEVKPELVVPMPIYGTAVGNLPALKPGERNPPPLRPGR